MERRFYRHLKTLVPNPEAAHFLLTVSGGKDSTVLAVLFHRLNLDFAIAHCNFHLRGEESDADMRFVQMLAEKYHKGLFIKEFDTFSAQRNSGKSIEMVARDLRYAWFEKISATFDYVVTAHHADDNAETILLNLARGTGLKGLSGIPPLNGKYLRPLLPFSSDEILQYAEKQHIPFQTDRTNFSEDYQRNKIRLSILPKLREINPEIIPTFTRNIAHFRQQYAFYARELDKKKENLCTKTADSLQISIGKLQKEPDKSLLLYEIMKPYGFSAAIINNILMAMTRSEAGQVFHSSSHQLLKDRNCLIIKKTDVSLSQEIRIADEKELCALGFEVMKCPVSEIVDFKQERDAIWVDAEKLRFPLSLRHWRNGDRFHPFGMCGQKKLSDFFINEKIDRFRKRQIRLLCSEDQIVWVVGLRADDRFKIDKTTKYGILIKQKKRQTDSPLPSPDSHF